MNLNQLKQKTPQQWLRIALIPALGTVLLFLTRQPVTGDSRAVETLALNDDPNALPIVSELKPASKWPTITLSEMVAFDPFEVPGAKQTDELDGASGTGKQGNPDGSVSPAALLGKVQAIYFDSRGTAAIVDSKVIRVGDTLPNGKRILEITEQGIKLEDF